MKINDIFYDRKGARRRLLSPRLALLLQSMFSLILLLWIGQSLDVPALRLHLGQINPAAIVLGILLVPVAVAMRAFRWHLLLKKMGINTAFKEVLSVVWIGQALNAFFPSGTGEVAKAYFLGESKGFWNRVVYSSVIDKLMGVGSVFFLGALPCYLLQQKALALLCALLALASLALPGILPRFSKQFESVPLPLLLEVFTISIFSWWLTYFILYLLFEPLVGRPIPVLFYFALAPAITVGRLLPISLNGIGVQELIIIRAMEQLGIGKEASFIASLAFTSITVILPALIGWGVLMHRWYRRSHQKAFK